MPATKTKLRKGVRGENKATASGGNTSRVLTLAETATYLRVSRDAVLALVNDQSLPGRRIGQEWRFLRSALDDWLRLPMSKSSKEALLAMAGNWKDDPHLEEMLAEIYEQRGRPIEKEEVRRTKAEIGFNS